MIAGMAAGAAIRDRPDGAERRVTKAEERWSPHDIDISLRRFDVPRILLVPIELIDYRLAGQAVPAFVQEVDDLPANRAISGSRDRAAGFASLQVDAHASIVEGRNGECLHAPPERAIAGDRHPVDHRR